MINCMASAAYEQFNISDCRHGHPMHGIWYTHCIVNYHRTFVLNCWLWQQIPSACFAVHMKVESIIQYEAARSIIIVVSASSYFGDY